MYPVSQAYLSKLREVGRKRRSIQGKLNNIAFDENCIVGNSLKYILQAVGNADIKLGGVFLGQVNLTFTRNFADNITRGDWDGLPLELSVGLEIEPDVFEYVPIGVFEVAEANHTMSGVEVTFYDSMLKFDKSLNLTTTSGSLYSLITFCCNKCHVELGMTREEIEAMPNGDEVFSVYPENDMTTYRDLISWIAVTMCAFATINREGKLEFRTWKSEPLYVFGIDDRFSGASFSDFVTRYTGMSVGNIAEQTTEYVHVLPDNGLTMAIGMNPLLQFGLPEVKNRQRMNILNALSNFEYTPFKAVSFIDPFIDLGDVLTFNGGMAGTTSKVCVMRIDFSYSKGVTLQGFGKNPALFGAQSKTNKDISGLASQSKGNENKFEVYTNAEVIDCTGYNSYMANVGKELVTLTFATNKDTTVEVNTNVYFHLQASNSSRTSPRGLVINEIYLEFYLNEEQVAQWKYRPLNEFFGCPETNNWFYMTNYYQSAMIPIIHYMPLLNIKGGEVNNLTVKLVYSCQQVFYNSTTDQLETRDITGTAEILAGDLMVTLRGQGLVVETPWDGYIRAEDAVPLQYYGSVSVKEMDESAEVTIIVPLTIGVSDSVQKQQYGTLDVVPMAENLAITMHRPKKNIISIRNGNFVNISKEENIITV